MSENKKTSPQIYSLSMEYKDELDKLKKLVELFSFQRKVKGEVSNILRSKLVILLALYLKDGFSRETKEKATEILGVATPSINSMNLELRQGNYLLKDKYNTRLNHLHPDLILLRDYVNTVSENGGSPFVLFQLKQTSV